MAVIAFGILTILALFGAVRWLDSEAGHRFVAEKIAEQRPASGLRISIGSIEGSLFKHVRLHDVRLADGKGQFALINEVDLRWYPLAWFVNRLDVDRLAIDSAELSRLPQLKTSGRRSSLLPDFDLRLLDLKVRRLALGPAVSGDAHILTIQGQADIRSGRAVLKLDARDLMGADRLVIDLDSRPDDRRFNLDAYVEAPKGGVIAGLAGLREDTGLAIKGEGDWAHWRGTLRADRGERQVADIAIDAREGQFALSGSLAMLGPLSPLGPGNAQLTANLAIADRVLQGDAKLERAGLSIAAAGGVDLARSRFDDLRVTVSAPDLAKVSTRLSGRNATLKARLSGPFEAASLEFIATLSELRQGSLRIDGVTARGDGRFSERGGAAWPVTLSISSLQTGVATFDRRLRSLRADGVVRFEGDRLIIERSRLSGPAATGILQGVVALDSGQIALSLDTRLGDLEIGKFGLVDLEAGLALTRPPSGQLAFSGRVRAQMRRLDNAFLAGLAGGLPMVTGKIALKGPVLEFTDLALVAPDLSLAGEASRARDGVVHIEAQGNHSKYGPLNVVLDGDIGRPTVDLTLHNPGQGLRLNAVHLLLDPTESGYNFVGTGRSALGPFKADGALDLPVDKPAIIRVDRLQLADVVASGSLATSDGFTGTLNLAGTVAGTLQLSRVGGIQRLVVDADLGGATFPGPTRIIVNRGRVRAVVDLKGEAIDVEGSVQARGVRYGSLWIGRLNGKLDLSNGTGKATVAASAQNGRTFDLSIDAGIAPGRLTLALSGTVDREPIRMPRPAVLRREGDGWNLEPMRISIRGGGLQVSAFLGLENSHVEARLARLPLSLLDLVDPELGLGGVADGTLVYDLPRGGVPTGKLSVRVLRLTRSGLALSSAPVDVGLNGALDAQRGAVRAIISEGGTVIGRAQALVSPLGSGTLSERLNAAPLQAEINYAGSAETLWRFTNIELLSFGGRVAISARATGTLADPQISGTVRAKDASLQSPATGMSLTHVSASGNFDGSNLTLADISAETARGGKVTGTANFDFSAARGIGMDVRLDTNRAVLLDRDDVGATVTGPMRITSQGTAGTISGNLEVVTSHFTLGRASTVAEIPHLRLIEINRAGEEVETQRPAEPWRLDIAARAAGGLMVEGLGMRSEWAADLQIGGTVTSPVFRGTAQLIDGNYDFAGKRFDLREGRLTFTGSSPVNPTLDIRAVADVSDLDATISVTGTSLRPIVTMSSIPAMPQDELLSRLLFGTSITQLSAPEAIQLAAAVAALQDGGDSLDPINALRRATGLSRLRILPADTTTGQKTSIAAGKNIGRLYVELITDGQGYSATRVEFQITRWLSLLSSVSTVGTQSIGMRVSKDY